MDRKISVIVPTINEEENIQGLVRVVNQMDNVEVIIADGGSQDKTYRILEGDCKIIHCKLGRANQMNAGAGEAEGEILWFLHADSLITTRMADDIRRVLKDDTYVGGGFSLRFDDPSLFLKMIARGSNARAKYLNLFFGDQGFFIKRSTFKEEGGFPPVSLMEDWILSKRAGKVGRLALLPEKIVTSSRRFRKNGIIRTFFFMQWIKFLFLVGVPTSKLERMYRRG